MRSIESFVAELCDRDLAKAVREIQDWKRTGILKDGITMAMTCGLEQEYFLLVKSVKIAEEAILERAAEKFVSLMGL